MFVFQSWKLINILIKLVTEGSFTRPLITNYIPCRKSWLNTRQCFAEYVPWQLWCSLHQLGCDTLQWSVWGCRGGGGAERGNRYHLLATIPTLQYTINGAWATKQHTAKFCKLMRPIVLRYWYRNAAPLSYVGLNGVWNEGGAQYIPALYHRLHRHKWCICTNLLNFRFIIMFVSLLVFMFLTSSISY